MTLFDPASIDQDVGAVLAAVPANHQHAIIAELDNQDGVLGISTGIYGRAGDHFEYIGEAHWTPGHVPDVSAKGILSW